MTESDQLLFCHQLDLRSASDFGAGAVLDKVWPFPGIVPSNAKDSFWYHVKIGTPYYGAHFYGKMGTQVPILINNILRTPWVPIFTLDAYID